MTSTLIISASSFAVVVGFAAFILIWNTIRLTSYAKREEIEIMKIVGASSLYIRFPFILEAIMESLLGAVVAVGLGVGLMNYISDSSISESIFTIQISQYSINIFFVSYFFCFL